MPLVRMIVSVRDSVATPQKESVVNTIYLNVSGSVDDPDYAALAQDLWTTWSIRQWAVGRYIDVRAYDMRDAEPRPQRARVANVASGTRVDSVGQVALCLSYYADRNLPRQRGRLYLGPWGGLNPRPSTQQMNQALGLADGLADLGGLNVDWSLWSPTTQQHTRINHAWVDDSWDIIRSRKLPGTSRVTKDLNG